MTVLLLVGLAVTVAVGVHRVIDHGGWASRAPRLGVLAWLASAAAAVVATVTTGLAVVWHERSAQRTWADALWRLCLDALAGAHGRGAQVVALSVSLLLAAGAVRLAVAWWQVVAGSARQRREHRAMLVLAAPDGGARALTVLAHPEPVAYVVAGRPARVVVSTTALAALSEAELAAVLAHERAHASGRHHWLLGMTALLRRAFPAVPLFAHAARQTARLVEMCADDAATRTHSRLTLARALVAMAAPNRTAAVLPVTGGDAAERLRRLLDPPRPLPAAARAVIAVGFGVLPLLPVLILAVGPAGTLLAGG